MYISAPYGYKITNDAKGFLVAMKENKISKCFEYAKTLKTSMDMSKYNFDKSLMYYQG
jgi:hypothetical protein